MHKHDLSPCVYLSRRWKTAVWVSTYRTSALKYSIEQPNMYFLILQVLKRCQASLTLTALINGMSIGTKPVISDSMNFKHKCSYQRPAAFEEFHWRTTLSITAILMQGRVKGVLPPTFHIHFSNYTFETKPVFWAGVLYPHTFVSYCANFPGWFWQIALWSRECEKLQHSATPRKAFLEILCPCTNPPPSTKTSPPITACLTTGVPLTLFRYQ